MARFLDLNGDGQVTSQDFLAAANMMGLHGTTAAIGSKVLFNMLDTDRSGTLNGNEAFGVFSQYPSYGQQQQVGYGQQMQNYAQPMQYAQQYQQYQQNPQMQQYQQNPQMQQYGRYY